MATVTVYTAARMQEIEDQAITDGHIDGDNLILVQNDSTEIDAGSVRGPQGDTGPAGPSNPAGVMLEYGGDTAPSGYLLCDGSQVSRATYSDLFDAIGTNFGNGDGSTTFNIPDRRGRFSAGLSTDAWCNIMGETGGSADAVVVTHTHVAPDHRHSTSNHTHSANHNHTASAANDTHNHGNTGYAGNHTHGIANGIGLWVYGTSGSGYGTVDGHDGGNIAPLALDTYSTVGAHRHSTGNDTHGHAITVNTKNFSTGEAGSGNTGYAGDTSTSPTGVGGTQKNLPPYITVNFIIKT